MFWKDGIFNSNFFFFFFYFEIVLLDRGLHKSSGFPIIAANSHRESDFY